MPENLQHAVIAIEDKDFYNEPGINIKRTIGAALNEFTDHALYGSQQGASTLEQQLIKNLTGDNETDKMRKVREIFLRPGSVQQVQQRDRSGSLPQYHPADRYRLRHGGRRQRVLWQACRGSDPL